MQRFMQAAGIPSMVHVPYPGSMPAVLALVTGDVQSMFSSPSTTLADRRATAKCACWRWPVRRAIPTRRRRRPWRSPAWPGFESNTWFALMASAKTPADVLEKIRADVGRAMRDPVVIKRINDIKSSPVGNTAEEFRQVIKDDLEIFRRVISAAK